LPIRPRPLSARGADIHSTETGLAAFALHASKGVCGARVARRGAGRQGRRPPSRRDALPASPARDTCGAGPRSMPRYWRRGALAIASRLKLEQPRIPPALLDELVMRALLDDPPLIHDDDPVRAPHRREAVRDQDRDLVPRRRAEMLEHVLLGLRVHRRGRLVEHEDLGFAAHERARARDPLPLPAGELLPLVEPAAERRLVCLGQRLDELLGPALTRGRAPALGVREHAYVADADVLADLELIAHEILKDDADALAQRVRLPVLQRQPLIQ